MRINYGPSSTSAISENLDFKLNISMYGQQPVGYAPAPGAVPAGAPIGYQQPVQGFAPVGATTTSTVGGFPGAQPLRPAGAVPIGGVPAGPVTQTYGLGGDPERRLNEASARQLARMVFLKYDDNDSGFMNSQEAANLITDLYASVNMEYRATPEEGKEFMKANDSDHNWQFNRQDFEDIFVKHLSTQNNFQGFNLFGDLTSNLPGGYKRPIHNTGDVTHFHRNDPINTVAGSNIPAPPVINNQYQVPVQTFGAGPGFAPAPQGGMYAPQPGVQPMMR